MFQLILHHKKPALHTHDWHEHVQRAHPNKRVVSKRETHPYQRGTLAESIHSACMKAFGFGGEAEMTALKVCEDVEHWLENKEEVTKQDIKRMAAQALQRYNPRAAYEYLPTKEYAVKKDEYGFIRL